MQFDEFKLPKISVEPFAFINDFQTRVFVQYADVVEKTDDGRSVVRWLSEDPRVTALNGKMISRGSGADPFHIRTFMGLRTRETISIRSSIPKKSQLTTPSGFLALKWTSR
jgi:hypothetical protein